ncbi:hypothetical protein IWZ03DRAFT_45052 [Phyllosticta citriasiana]|uniref:Uncharacterized protein n=1 Tax=Phyllosticta citriasiana TaxID=595635 RepID=A0ABR1KGK6_9PEZI
MVSKLLIAGLLASQAASNPLDLYPRRATCGKNMQVCSPSGATTSHLPSLGPDLSSLYVDLLSTVDGVHFAAKRHANSDDDDDNDDDKDETVAFCCSAATSCLLLSSSTCPGKIPICYDKYTTNFVLPDGTTGTIAAGTLNLPDGSSADLFSGAYTNASTHISGNLYTSSSSSPGGESFSHSNHNAAAAAAADKPNTATLSIPPVYTAAGVGSAIPISALGTLVTSVATSVETLVSQATLPPTTRAAAETDAAGSTVAPATTRSAETVIPTTVLSTHASTVTTEEPAAATGSGAGTGASSASPTPSGFTGAAGSGRAALAGEAKSGVAAVVVLGAAMLLGGVAGVR